MSNLYPIFALKMKAIHNKDFSVVKTLKTGFFKSRLFLC